MVQRLGKVRGRVCLCDGGDVAEVGGGQVAGACIAQDEIAGGKRRLGIEEIRRRALGRILSRLVGDRPGVVVDHAQCVIEIGIDRDEIGGVDTEAQQQEHGGDGGHGDADKAPLQPPDHGFSSSR